MIDSERRSLIVAPRGVQPFLTANWRYLAMLNYVVDPRLISPLVPPGTEIDFEDGETFLSVVGFLFLDTRLLGLPVPLHRDFEEVNLRFYVRRKSADTWRRGVVFIREIVPRQAIALIARACYGENYVALPMKHEIAHVDSNLNVEFSWRRSRKWESLKMRATGEPQPIPATDFELNADAANLYGKQFVETLNKPPRSAFVADGSPITVARRSILL
jgi:uncharacterized protein YqjF (DUF2071 family)